MSQEGSVASTRKKRTKTFSLIDKTLSNSMYGISKAKSDVSKAWTNMRNTLSKSKNLKRLASKGDDEMNFSFNPVSAFRKSTRGKGFSSFLENFKTTENKRSSEEKLKLLQANVNNKSSRRDEVFDKTLDTDSEVSPSSTTKARLLNKTSRGTKNSLHSLNSVQSLKSMDEVNLPHTPSQHSLTLSLKKYKNLDKELPSYPKTPQDKVIILKALSSNLLFADLSTEELDMITSVMEIVELEKDEELFRQDEEGSTFYIVRNGKLQMTKDTETSIECDIGTCFGEVALMYKSKRQASVHAIEDSEVFSLSRVHYRQIIAFSESSRLEGIKNSLSNCSLLKTLTPEQIFLIAECVTSQKFSKGTQIIEKGSTGDTFYFIKSGSVLCSQIGDEANNKVKDIELHENDYFGERALVKNEVRAANVFAIEDTEVLTLDRKNFNLHLGSLVELLNRNIAFRALKAMPLLHELADPQLIKLIDLFKVETFRPQEIIIEQGVRNLKLYIIISGTVEVVFFSDTDRDKHTKVAELSQGDYFGESALQQGAFANAEVIAKDNLSVYSIDVQLKKTAKLLKPLAKTIKKNQTLRAKKTIELFQKQSSESEDGSFSAEKRMSLGLMLEELDHVKTLGTGTFGRVKLVEHKRSGKTYALKILQKASVVQFKQQQNVLNEKLVMMKSDHPFILKLYKTFQSKNCLYFLLEYIPGGELFSLLHIHGGSMKNPVAKFYAACVADALVYLHIKSIVYRDLKPENAMIDAEGYIRLVDFGFAKRVTTRTFTLCGTPEYLAPESVQNKGHTRAVDYWALGILIYELLAGFSPFADYEHNSQEEIFERILRGKFGFTSGFNEEAKDLVRRLLVRNFRQRLGMFKDGPEELKMHIWFSDLDFEKLIAKELKAPWVPEINGMTDTQHFDIFDEDDTEAPYKGSNKAWANF